MAILPMVMVVPQLVRTNLPVPVAPVTVLPASPTVALLAAIPDQAPVLFLESRVCVASLKVLTSPLVTGIGIKLAIQPVDMETVIIVIQSAALGVVVPVVPTA